MIRLLHWIHLSIIFSSEPLPFTAPSAPPTVVKLLPKSSTSIALNWRRPADCRHENGEITGYSVRYGEEGSGEADWRFQMASGDSSGGMTTVSLLTKETVYSVEVAAETSAGTGVYSELQTIETPTTGENLFFYQHRYFPESEW